MWLYTDKLMTEIRNSSASSFHISLNSVTILKETFQPEDFQRLRDTAWLNDKVSLLIDIITYHYRFIK